MSLSQSGDCSSDDTVDEEFSDFKDFSDFSAYAYEDCDTQQCSTAEGDSARITNTSDTSDSVPQNIWESGTKFDQEHSHIITHLNNSEQKQQDMLPVVLPSNTQCSIESVSDVSAHIGSGSDVNASSDGSVDIGSSPSKGNDLEVINKKGGCVAYNDEDNDAIPENTLHSDTFYTADAIFTMGNVLPEKVPNLTEKPDHSIAHSKYAYGASSNSECPTKTGLNTSQNSVIHSASSTSEVDSNLSDANEKSADSSDSESNVENIPDFDKNNSSSSMSEELGPVIRGCSDDDLTFRVPTSEEYQNLDENYTDFASFAPNDATFPTDSWASFDQAETGVNNFDTETDDFGDFCEISSNDNLQNNNNDDLDGFGDFTGTPAIESQSTTSSSISHTPMESMLGGCFIDISTSIAESLDEQLGLLTELIEKESEKVTPDELNTPGWSKGTRSGPSVFDEVWTGLLDVGTKATLVYQWHDSASNKKLFCTLNIDPRNILHLRNRKFLPLFASNLGSGVLEPTKGASSKPNVEQPPQDTTTSQTQRFSPHSIQPVLFDWSSSGLTNPLESSDSRFLNLNISFPSTGTTDVINPMKTFSKTMPVRSSYTTADTVLNDVDQKSSRVSKGQDENLSEEAKAIISTLPDLSFMKTGMLMFPVK